MKSPITVHNVTEKDVVADLLLYCGRNALKYPHLIDAKMGNPFVMRHEYARGAATNAYAKLLADDPEHPHWARIRRIQLRLSEGKSVALFCHCAPKRCHCDHIRDLVTGGDK